MLPGQIDALLTLVTYFSIFYFHEAGHYYVAKYFHAKNLKVFYRKECFVKVPYCVFYDDPDVEGSALKVFFISIGGILAGLIPIALLYVVVEPFFEVIPFVFGIFYLISGCFRDCVDIGKLIMRGCFGYGVQ